MQLENEYQILFRMLSSLGLESPQEILGFWLICMVVVGRSSYLKGLNVTLWIVFAFIAGPFAIPCVMAFPKNQHALDERDVESKKKRWCPFCKEAIKQDAISCHCCNNILDPQEHAELVEKLSDPIRRRIHELLN